MNNNLLGTLVLTLFCAGCVAGAASVEVENLLLDNEGDVEYSPIIEPSSTVSVDEEEMLLENTNQVVDSLEDMFCMCEWEGWEVNGLRCVGIQCSDSCPTNVRVCNERMACVPF